MTTPETRLNSPENIRILKDAAYSARYIARKVGKPGPVSVGSLEDACGAANTVARNLNKLCGNVIDRTGRGAEIAALKAENAELRNAASGVLMALDGFACEDHKGKGEWAGYQNGDGIECGTALDAAIATMTAAMKGGVA